MRRATFRASGWNRPRSYRLRLAGARTNPSKPDINRTPTHRIEIISRNRSLECANDFISLAELVRPDNKLDRNGRTS